MKRQREEQNNEEQIKRQSKNNVASSIVINEKATYQECPYLATIDRRAIDFDQAPTCCETLSTQHVYACLVCGKYYSGRGTKTPAFKHSLDMEHHVFVQLQSGRFYCLPDDYEVHDPSLNDIAFNLHPRFTNDELDTFMEHTPVRSRCRALDGHEFHIGLMGIDNIKKNDWLNVIVQMLQTVHPIIKSLIMSLNEQSSSDPHKLDHDSQKTIVNKAGSSPSAQLLDVFAEFCAKLWNPRAFRSHVNPHQLIECMSAASNRSIKLGEHTNPLIALSFLINTLHREITAGKRNARSVITDSFQGELLIETLSDDEKTVVSSQRSHFFHLSLKLPSAPLFAETDRRTILPSVHITELLSKFNRQTVERDVQGTPKRFSVLSLPKYLVIHYQRFNDNTFAMEKNPTLVTFPLTSLALKSLVQRQIWEDTPMKELVATAKKRGLPVVGEKSDLIDAITGIGNDRAARYDCYANIVHEGSPQTGSYRVHVRRQDQWFDIQDAKVVTSDTMHQTVLLSESYMQLYQRVD